MAEKNRVVPTAICGDRFLVGTALGSGAFSTVFVGYDTFFERDVAIKAEPRNARSRQLRHEIRAYEAWQCKVGATSNKNAFAPQLIWSGKDATHRYAVFERVGPSLADALYGTRTPRAPGPLPLKDVLVIACALIRHVRAIHEQGYLHCDIKPANVCLASPQSSSSNDCDIRPAAEYTEYLPQSSSSNEIVCIDFGMVKRWVDDATGAHVAWSSKVPFGGTPSYASDNVLSGERPSRRDDMISLGYTLISLARGGLPWRRVGRGVERAFLYTAVKNARNAISMSELTAGLPPSFAIYMKHVTTLAFAEQPHYDAMMVTFETSFRSLFPSSPMTAHVFGWTLPAPVPSPRPTATIAPAPAKRLRRRPARDSDASDSIEYAMPKRLKIN